MSTEPAPWRDGHEGSATPAQMRAGVRWADRRRHYAPRTAAQALHDHEAGEAADQARQIRTGGNR